MVGSRSTGGIHPRPPLRPGGNPPLCGRIFTGNREKSRRARSAHTDLLRAAWAPGFHGPNGEWERCTEDTGLPLLGVQSYRKGPDTRFHESRKCCGQRREAAQDFLDGSLNRFHLRVEYRESKCSDTAVSEHSLVKLAAETRHRFHANMRRFTIQSPDESDSSVM